MADQKVVWSDSFEGRVQGSERDWVIRMNETRFLIELLDEDGKVVESFSGRIEAQDQAESYQVYPDTAGKEYFPFVSEHGYEMVVSRRKPRTITFPCSDVRGQDVVVLLSPRNGRKGSGRTGSDK